MRHIKPLNEKKPKGAPEFHHSDAPDAEGRFKDLGIKDLAAWLIKTRKKDVKKISGSLTQQIVFNRGDDPKYAEKMEKVRKEVYKQLGRQDLIDKMDESLQEPLYNSFFLLEFQKWVYKNRAKINRMSKDEKIEYLEDNYIKKYGNKHLGSEDLSGVGSDIYHSLVLDNIIKESVNEAKMPKKYIGNDEIVYLKTKEDSRGAHYNLYYKGHDIDKGGHRFGSEKELEDFAANYILSNQLYRKLRYEDSIPLPESIDSYYLDNAKDSLEKKKVYQHLGVEYGQTRRGDKYVQINYIPVSRPQSQQPEWVKVFYDNDKDLKKISKELDMDLKESVLNEEDTWNDYPAAAKKNAQMAIDWKEKYGRDEVDAGTPVGWARAHQLAKGENLSTDTVKRMSAFNRHRKNSSIAPEHKATPWKDKGYVAWLIWGGDEGVDWAIEKSKEIDAMKESKQMKYIKPLYEAKRGAIHKAAKKGSYPVSIVVINSGMVVKQELVKTPAAVPAVFNELQKEYPNAVISIESSTGETLFSESVTEGIYAKESKIVPGEYIKTQYGYFYKRVEGKVGGQDAYVEIKKGKEGKRKTSIHDTVDFDIVDKSVALGESVTEGMSKSAIKKAIKVIDQQIEDEEGGDGEPLDNETLQALEQERERLLGMNERKLNEGYWSHYEYDKWTKENGKPKYPKWVKVTLKEIVKGGFMDPVYDAEHNYMVLWLASLETKRRSELYAYDNKGKKELGKVGYAMYQRFYNDLTSYNMFFMQGAMYALEVSKHIRDMEANGEPIEPAYYLMKEYFNNMDMDTKRSRVFNAAYEKLEKWMKDNNIKTL